uniref:Uncharacterized protein n=1 Tax=Chelonoidis abingdonii TaxID=106734 RepID=A0A8C0ITX9_CHEAB
MGGALTLGLAPHWRVTGEGLTAMLSVAGVPWCPAGWDQDQGRCYLFSQNADLVVINDQTEQVRALGPTPPWGVMTPGQRAGMRFRRCLGLTGRVGVPGAGLDKNGDENCAHLFAYRWICERVTPILDSGSQPDPALL